LAAAEAADRAAAVSDADAEEAEAAASDA